MASPSTPTHGKIGNIYRLRPNNFSGSGLNDATWGTGYSGAGSSAYFEVVIDGEESGGGGVDTFKWRKDGGGWTETVDITGAAQTLSDSQTITFAATTGHTATDQWVIGNLDSEACTESGATAQITATAKRILNPNSSVTFTDAGGANCLSIDYTRAYATFDANVGAVTVSGNNGYILQSSLEHVGYGYQWTLDSGLDMADISVFQAQWKTALPGQAGVSGSFEAYFIGTNAAFEALEDAADGTQKYFLLELYTYDPDGDQTGDRFVIWATLSGINYNAPISEVVKEAVTFQAFGAISQTANA